MRIQRAGTSLLAVCLLLAGAGVTNTAQAKAYAFEEADTDAIGNARDLAAGTAVVSVSSAQRILVEGVRGAIEPEAAPTAVAKEGSVVGKSLRILPRPALRASADTMGDSTPLPAESKRSASSVPFGNVQIISVFVLLTCATFGYNRYRLKREAPANAVH